MLRIGAKAVILLFAFSLVVPARAADASREALRIRTIALESAISVRRTLLTAKWQSLAQLDSLIRNVIAGDDTTAAEGDPQSPDKAKELYKTGLRRTTLETERYQLLQDIQDLYLEIDTLQAELQKIRTDLAGTQQLLEGHWVMTLMPAGTKGDVFLSQNGTLVTGDYSLDNGQAGSLQGTFVNNVLVLERIDARYGKMGRVEGALAKDRRSVKGSWFSYDFASGQPITGAFTLDRVQEETGP